MAQSETQMINPKPTWLQAMREEAWSDYQTSDYPTRQVEEWKYTNLKFMKGADLTPYTDAAQNVTAQDLPEPLLGKEGQKARVVIVNGVYREDLSNISALPQTVTVCPLNEALAKNEGLLETYLKRFEGTATHAMHALNTHYFTNGVFVYVPQGEKIEQPIEITNVTVGKSDALACCYPRHVFVVQENAEATILEHLVGSDQYLSNIAYDITVQDNGLLHHYRHQNENQNGGHQISTTRLSINEKSHYDGFTLTTGAKLARNEVHGKMHGDDGTCRVNGCYLNKDDQHSDTTIIIHHEKERGVSNQVFKGILDDAARGVFQGKIHVHPGAQKTDGYQLNNAILLCNQAEVDVKPELEIYADDVKCSHGATTGQLDDGSLFYLRSRGLPERQAKQLLLQAFITEAVDEIEHETIRETFTELAHIWIKTQLDI